MKVGFIGAGEMTEALGRRLISFGYDVLVGSRDRSKAEAVTAKIGGGQAGSYADAAAFGEVVFLALHNNAVLPALESIDAELLKGKVLVDCNNPVDPPDFENRYSSNGSLAEDIASAVPAARVVKAFNTIYAEVIDRVEQPAGRGPVTFFVAGDDPKAKEVVAKIGKAFGYAVVDAGDLRKARHLENLAAFEIDLAFGQHLAPYVEVTLSLGRADV